MNGIAGKVRTAGVELRNQIGEIQQVIQDTQDEIDWLSNSPLPAAEIKARVTADIAERGARFFAEQQKGQVIYSGAVDELLTFQAHSDPFAEGVTIANTPIKAAPVLCWLFPDQLAARIGESLDNCELSFASGPPSGERPHLIEAATARLLILENQEEDLITEGEGIGLEIARREDANPAVILGAYEAHVYKFRGFPHIGNYHVSEIESDESLSRTEILTRARHALPSDWLAEYELESIEILGLNNDDILDDDEATSHAKPRTTARRTARQKQFQSPAFEKSAIEAGALRKDLGIETPEE